mmetsp:Transcript_5505/g.12860  ORF Transcript_5505/g.12860 Transcript_5505/m.12860 type:complete len:272 (-) Transcript_5505:8-823(-)
MLDLCHDDQELSGVSQIQDETVSLESVRVERRRRQSQESELTELRTSSEVQSALISSLRDENKRLEVQDEEISKLRKALEVQTTNVDRLLRESQRLQTLEAELAEIGTRSEAQDLCQKSDSLLTEEVWSLTSPSDSTVLGGPGFDSVTMSSPAVGTRQLRNSVHEAAVLSTTATGGDDSRRCSVQDLLHLADTEDTEEPWRLVRTILGVLDAMQQKLGRGAGRLCPSSCGGWRSMISVDIRILVGVGQAGTGSFGEEAHDETSRTFMYVLI